MPSRAQVNPFSEALLRSTLSPFVRALWQPKLEGAEHFPQGPCFVYGNHSNNLDPFILNLFTPWGRPTAGVMTLERLRSGFVARLFRSIGLLPTRKHVREPHLIRRIYRLLDQGRPVVIYPEGGRRWDGRPAPWITSTAKLFVRAGVPVHPVITHGSYVGWPRWARYPRPARIRVECRPPLTFDLKTPMPDALARLKAPIALDENTVPAEVRPQRAFRPAEGITHLLYRDPETGEADGLHTPDGYHVVNRAGTLRLKMLPDSTLLDERTGQRHTTGALYDRIRALPLTPGPGGALIRHDVDLHLETDQDTLERIPHGHVRASLFPDGIHLQGPRFTRTIGLEDLLHTGIERKFKLQLHTRTTMYQLSFTRGGSALYWEDALKRLTTRPEPRV